MKIFSSFSGLPVFKKKTAVTIGVFDGMHVGHRRLLEETIKCGQAFNGRSAVITFVTHPEKHLNKESGIQLIKSVKARVKRISLHGIDMLFLLDFKKISHLTAEEFVRDILVKSLNTACVTAGRDFVFGAGGRGNVGLLKKMGKQHGFKVNVVDDVKIGGKRASSTLIRKYLKDGDIKKAEKMLGRRYSITGRVVHGSRAGFELPTANLNLDYEEIPARGVWAVKVEYKKRAYTGAANIGFAPTLKNEKKQLLEVYIFGFRKKIYGEEIKVVFLERIRDEKKFSSHEALLKQVKKDIKYIREKYNQ